MKLVTYQPISVWKILLKRGEFFCNPTNDRLFISDGCRSCTEAYYWLAEKMETRFGRPKGVCLPIWAWYADTIRNEEKWGYENWSHEGIWARIELEVPDEEVLLTDFEEWNNILNGSPVIMDWETSEEYCEMAEAIEAQGKEAIRQSWEGVIIDDCSKRKDCDIQATFWSLKHKYIRAVRIFACCSEI